MASRLLVLCTAASLAIACHHEAGTGAAPPPEPSAAASAAGPAKAEYHEDTFDLSIVPSGVVTAGQPSSVEIRLAAKAGYHVNDKYPYKFKVGEGAGVKYASPVFTRDAIKLEEERASMKVDFTPESSGDKSVSGTFSFSLCSAERCLVEKRDLATTLPVARAN